MVYRVVTTDLRLYRLYNVQYNVPTQYRNGESDISREYDVLHILSTSHSMGTLSQILHVQLHGSIGIQIHDSHTTHSLMRLGIPMIFGTCGKRFIVNLKVAT